MEPHSLSVRSGLCGGISRDCQNPNSYNLGIKAKNFTESGLNEKRVLTEKRDKSPTNNENACIIFDFNALYPMSYHNSILYIFIVML